MHDDSCSAAVAVPAKPRKTGPDISPAAAVEQGSTRKKTYSELLRDPRWQKRRMELLEAANWTCQECGSKTTTLNVHHGFYKRNKKPWEYTAKTMHVLCEECHPQTQAFMEDVHEIISRSNKMQLFLLSEFLSPLYDDQDQKWRNTSCDILEMLTMILYSSHSVGEYPKSKSDFEWISRSATHCLCEMAEISGYENGLRVAEATKPTA